MKPDTCYCCEPPTGGTPVAIGNRPGLSAVAYRVGTFANFRQAMFQAISRSAELYELSTRQSDDHAITILELWAAVADVLTFYQERIANEAFLRTALQRESVLRMARMIGYELSPGSAATVFLSFTAEKDKQVEVPVGLRVQSVPEQDEKPQKYETLEKLAVYDWLNEQKYFPSPSGSNPLAKGATISYLAPGEKGLSIAENLVEGDHVLLFDPAGSEPVEELVIKEIEAEHEHMIVHWSTPIQGENWNMVTRAAKRARSFRHFGYNVPPTYPKANISSGIIQSWTIQGIGTGTPGTDNFALAGGNDLYLDSLYDDLTVGTRLLLVDGTNQQKMLTIEAVTQDDRTLGPITSTVTRVTVTPSFLQIADRRQVIIYELSNPQLLFWGYRYPATIDSANAYIPGRRIDAETIEIARPIEKNEYQEGYSVRLTDIEAGRRVLLKDEKDLPIAAIINRVRLTGGEIAFGVTTDDAETVKLLALDQDSTRTVAALFSAVLDPLPVISTSAPSLKVIIGDIGSRTITLGGSLATLSDAADSLQSALRAADPDPLFSHATVLVLDHRLMILPGDDKSTVAFSETANDETTVVNLGLEDKAARTLDGCMSGLLDPSIAYTRNPSQMSVTIGPIAAKQFDLDHTKSALADVAADLESKLRAADVAPLFKYARVKAHGHRLLVFPGMIGHGYQEYLKIELRLTGTVALDRNSAVLMGNVANASHGETIASEILGDADPTIHFQHFSLKKSPVTHVPSAGQVGADSTLQLFVNDALWTGVDTLYGQTATDTVYTARINDQAEMSVRFGDGATGARPPNGRANVVAAYRQGIGLEGWVKAGQLKTLLDKPKGLKAATNPAEADGGADPETLDHARQNAPATVRTFDRAVSLLDLEDLARSRSEVAKAKVTWVWNGNTRVAHLTIAAQSGSTFSSSALKRIHASLTANRDPNRRLMLANYITVPILINATLKVADTHVSSKVAAAAHAVLLDALSFESLAFAQSIHLSDVYAILQGVSGVVAVDIDGFMYKQKADVTDSQFAGFLSSRGVVRAADGTPKPLQDHIWILGAQPNRASNDPAVLPAEQAHVDSPSQDVIILTSGGLPD